MALAKRVVRYGDSLLAAPVAGRRAACAALAWAAGQARPRAGTVVVAWVTEQNLGARGLLAVMNQDGPFGATVILDGDDGGAGMREVADTGRQVPAALGRVTRWLLAARYAGTPVETVNLEDVAALGRRVSSWIVADR